MNILDRIRLSMGLFWSKQAIWIIAEWIALIIGILVATYALASFIRTGNEYFQKATHADSQVRVERERADHYERIVLSCLQHSVVLVNGNPTVCEL